MKAFLNRIDIYGQIPSFNFKKTKSMTNMLGGFLTVSILAFGIFILYFFGQELWIKKSPTVNISKLDEGYPGPLFINFIEFNVIMAVATGANIAKVIDPTIYKLNASLAKVTMGGSLVYIPIDMVPCSVDNKTDPILIQNIDPTQVWCLARNQTNFNESELYIKGFYGNTGFQMLQFEVFQCENTTSSQICKPQNIIDEFFHGAFFEMNTYDYLIQTSNYTTPFVKALKNYFFTISNKYSSLGTLFLDQVDIVSDVGLLLSDTKTERIYQNENMRIDLELSKIDRVSCVNIEFYNVKYLYNRNYQKLQDVLAQVGGFLNVMSIMFDILYSSYRNHVFFEEISYSYFKFRRKSSDRKGIFKEENQKKAIGLNQISEKTLQNQISLHSQKLKNNFLSDLSEIKINTPNTFNFKIGFFQKLFCLDKRKFCLPKNQKKLEIFRKVSDILMTKLDVFNYLNQCLEIEKLKSILLDSHQQKILDMIPNYFDLDDKSFNESRMSMVADLDLQKLFSELRKKNDQTSQNIIKYCESNL